ncbi:MAG: hypothetical protein JNM55_03875 [Anaerolineales bacterium]|nr:hypothetical protein [Anaerolineales bacterium]
MKPILTILSTMILLTACGPAATIPATTIPTTQPTETSIPVPPTEAMPAPLEMLAELNLSHIDPLRVIPSALDPNTSFEQVLAEYTNLADGNSQPMTWFSGTANGKFDFQLDLDLAPSAVGQTITFQTPLRVTIASTEASAQSLNLISPAFSGGGGLTNSFPTFNVQPGTIELNPDEVYGMELAPGGASGILHGIHAACVQTGIYNVTFQIPYNVTANGVTQSKMIPYSMVLACPLEETVWIFDPETEALVGTQNLIFQNGTYVQQ